MKNFEYEVFINQPGMDVEKHKSENLRTLYRLCYEVKRDIYAGRRPNDCTVDIYDVKRNIFFKDYLWEVITSW